MSQAGKLWAKGGGLDPRVEAFTIGRDAEFDMQLAPFDVLGTLAHTQMLAEVGLLPKSELPAIQKELQAIYQRIEKGTFQIEAGMEDVHSQVEADLTRALGDIGKKVHSGRSRNDQVLVDLKLYLRDRLETTARAVEGLFTTLQAQSEAHKDKLLPGYTHLQLAMPSSFGLWFGAYAEALAEDLLLLQTAYRFANRNPLGSAAGYGSSFPLDRDLTSELLGFDGPHVNVVAAQMSRGRAEKVAAMALAQVASTVARMAMDVCLYMNQNFGFLSFPDALTTGSSIMPHKKNPDVFELIRGRCNRLQALPNEIAMLLTNLPSGYHRELQLMKEGLFPAFETLNSCLEMAGFMLEHAQIKEGILEDPKYQSLFSVEVVNQLVQEGMPFRDAYKEVGKQIAEGTYAPSTKLDHTHLGTIGNLGTARIKAYFEENLSTFPFAKVKAAQEKLLV